MVTAKWETSAIGLRHYPNHIFGFGVGRKYCSVEAFQKVSCGGHRTLGQTGE